MEQLEALPGLQVRAFELDRRLCHSRSYLEQSGFARLNSSVA